MPTLINKSFFVGDINIPNLDHPMTLERLNFFIAEREEMCLKHLLGWPLYKALKLETDGLVTINIIGGTTRYDEQIRVGTTIGLVAGASGFVFDGTGGKPDYRGYQIVPTEISGRGILINGVDYSWNYATGEFQLLLPGDLLQPNAYYNIHFEPSAFLQQAGVSNGNANTLRMLKLLYGSEYTCSTSGEVCYWNGLIHNTKSLIADYIYYYWMEANISQVTGVNTNIPNVEASTAVSPAQKMISVWNKFSHESQSLLGYLWNSYRTTYPEFTYRQYWITRSWSRPINSFGI